MLIYSGECGALIGNFFFLNIDKFIVKRRKIGYEIVFELLRPNKNEDNSVYASPTSLVQGNIQSTLLTLTNTVRPACATVCHM